MSEDQSVTNLDEVLAERGVRYGVFSEHAKLSQDLKGVLARAFNAKESVMGADQFEALEMICHKMARICNGDPNYADSWRDIAGYATLVADRLEGVSR